MAHLHSTMQAIPRAASEPGPSTLSLRRGYRVWAKASPAVRGTRSAIRSGVISLLLLCLLWTGCSTLIPISLPYNAQINDQEAWLTLGGNDQHTHASRYDVPPPLRIAWKKRVGSSVADHPLAAADFIFLTTYNGLLYTLDLKTMSMVSKGRFGVSSHHVPTLYSSILYATMDLGKKTLIGFDLTLAKEVLSAHYPPITTSPLIYRKKVYFGTYVGKFYCASAGSGLKMWEFDAGSPIHSSPARLGETIVFATEKGRVFALDTHTGKQHWSTNLEGAVFGHAVIADSALYLGTVTGKLYALHLSDGSVLWHRQFPGSIYGSPSVWQDQLYLGNNAHQVVAVNRQDGSIAWRFTTRGIVNSTPLVSPRYLYVGSWDGQFYVLDRDSGTLLDQHDLKKPIKSAPIIYRNLVLVHVANKSLVAFARKEPLISLEQEE